MLVLGRKDGQVVRIRVGGEEVSVVLHKATNGRATLGVLASPHVSIVRAELEEPQPPVTERAA